MNTRNSTKVVYIDTAMHRCTQMAEDVSYPLDHQGRNCKTPVPAVSMFAGTPTRSAEDNRFRGVFWRFASVVLAALWGALIWSVCRGGDL